jgi:hypothetical protein
MAYTNSNIKIYCTKLKFVGCRFQDFIPQTGVQIYDLNEERCSNLEKWCVGAGTSDQIFAHKLEE